jgi:Ycf66 protein N-terminus
MDYAILNWGRNTIMLAYILAIAVGLGSFSLYMAAFFFPEVYRKYDFIWSGVGMFYALVLWVCAGRITGGVLLGQMASVALLGWLGWQTLGLRRSLTPIHRKTQIPTSAKSIVKRLPRQGHHFWNPLRKRAQTPQAQDLQGASIAQVSSDALIPEDEWEVPEEAWEEETTSTMLEVNPAAPPPETNPISPNSN